ncbi:2OG-Fe(II) oxygenase [filamentous cyanobacterium LEGE 11480]|uniref:2OG-Fe(II) oxygenase n=1 Tax=Romeriopsis navalis LEGE 11480 TaxID=2777977 RepID=A0A928VLL0_9CYAN|nr:2OG-Fe(II) oxygenase [Romeriopsis navalis]MBE9030801.1 2OG-Fe(II) oxygenase [Romeriopsis navalis LEGE 11480]
MDYTVTDLGSEVLLIEDILPPDICQHVIDVAEHCHFEAAAILVESVDPDVRNSGILPLNPRNPVQQSTNQLLLQSVKTVQEALYRWYGVQFPHAETCSVLRYLPGQQYKRHVDNILLASRFQEVEQGIPTRDISIVGYLNDDFEGGETFFDRSKLKVKPKAGSAIIFPAYYTHPHQALPVTAGKKYAWTTWLYH